MADIPPEPAGFRRIGRKFPSVGPNRSPRMGEFEKLDYSVRQCDEFDAVVVAVEARVTWGITVDLRSPTSARCVLRVERFAVGVLLAHGRLMLFLSKFRQRWRSSIVAQTVE